jgi:hypothetical protein
MRTHAVVRLDLTPNEARVLRRSAEFAALIFAEAAGINTTTLIDVQQQIIWACELAGIDCEVAIT